MVEQSGILRRGAGSRLIRIARGMACLVLATQLVVSPLGAAGTTREKAKSEAKPAAAAPDVVLKAMQNELARATEGLAKSEPAPYYLGYTVYDQNLVVLVGAYGSLLTDTAVHRRQADVTMRVGSPALDNTHGQSRPSGMSSVTLPLGYNQDAIPPTPSDLTDPASN